MSRDLIITALRKPAIQRALLQDRPRGLYGEQMDVAAAGGLIRQQVHSSQRGVRRTFRFFLDRTPRWALAVAAIADARRSLNMSVDPLEVGPYSTLDRSRSYRQWRQVWREGESPTTLRKVAMIAADQIIKLEKEA